MKIFIFSELYFPNLVSSGYFLTEIAEHLALQNDVTVITIGKNENSLNSIRNGVKIIRLRSKIFNKYNLLERVFAFFKISILFYNYALKLNIKKGERVICVTNPALFIPFIAHLKTKLKFKLTIFIHDVFPENLVATKILSSRNLVYIFLLKIFNNSYLKTDELIVCGRDMKLLFEKKLKNYSGKIKFIPNWADTKLIFPTNNINKFKNNNKLVFQYAGNIGRAQGIPSLTSAIQKVRSSKFEFHFYGKGPLLNNIINSNFENIFYKGSFQRKESNKVLNSCDVSIVTLEKKMLGLGVPSKTYNILSAGKPILYIGDKKSEIAILINKKKVGYVAEPANQESIVKGIEWFLNLSNNDFKALQINSREVALNFYSKEIVLIEYSKLISN